MSDRAETIKFYIGCYQKLDGVAVKQMAKSKCKKERDEYASMIAQNKRSIESLNALLADKTDG